MKNKIKKILLIFTIAMALIVPLPLTCEAENNFVAHDISAMAKKPIAKKEIAFRFIMAMLGVATSSVIIYIGLSLYNKYMGVSNNVVGLNNISKSKMLNATKESLKVFLKKTNWD